jgi:hypothetical protein
MEVETVQHGPIHFGGGYESTHEETCTTGDVNASRGKNINAVDTTMQNLAWNWQSDCKLDV